MNINVLGYATNHKIKQYNMYDRIKKLFNEKSVSIKQILFSYRERQLLWVVMGYS